MSIIVESSTEANNKVNPALSAQDEGREVEDTEESKAAPDEDAQDESSDSGEELEQDDSASSKDEDKDEDGEKEDSSEENHENSNKGNRVQKRINKLTSKLSKKDQEIEFLKEQLMKQSRNESVREPKEQDDSTNEKASFKDDGRPQKPVEDNFDTYDEYLAAQDEYLEKLTDWKVENRFKEQEKIKTQEKFKKEFEKKVQTHTERINKFRESNPDFDEVVMDAQDWAKPTVALETLVLDSEISDVMAYELFKDRELFESINSLDPMKMGVAFGRLEASLQKSKSSNLSKETKTTKAPSPVNPVGGKSVRATAKSIDEPGISYEEYKRRRQKSMNN